MTRPAIRYNMCFELGPKFDEVMDIWKISCLTSLYGDCTRSQICHDKTTFRSKKPTPPINFWTLEMGLSCSARVRRLLGILRRAHVMIFFVAYGNFRSQLSGFSRIFEDFDWAPVIFTQDVQLKTYVIFPWKYFFQKIKNRSRWYYAESNSTY